MASVDWLSQYERTSLPCKSWMHCCQLGYSMLFQKIDGY